MRRLSHAYLKYDIFYRDTISENLAESVAMLRLPPNRHKLVYKTRTFAKEIKPKMSSKAETGKSCSCGQISRERPGLCRTCGMFADTEMIFPIPKNALETYSDEYILGNISLIKQFMKIKDLNESRGFYMK